MSENRRWKWTAEEKLRIVLEGMQARVEVSDLCRREEITPTMYYAWKKRLLSPATKVFEEQGNRPSAREQRRAAGLARMRAVIAEITAENLELKKRLAIRGSGARAGGVARGGGTGAAARAHRASRPESPPSDVR